MKVSRIDVIGQNGPTGEHYLDESLFENENYTVFYVEGAGEYQVISRVTGAIESRQESLPAALIKAQEFNQFLVHKLHENIRVVHEPQQAVFDFGELDGPDSSH
mgnify:CR=1 FL=1